MEKKNGAQGAPEERNSSDSTLDSFEEHYHPSGLGWFVTALFLLGDMVGGGLVSLPLAAVQTNIYVSLLLILLMTAVTIYTASLLGECWNMLLKRWPKYRQHCRKPYPEIARRALGKRWKSAVSLCIDVTQFGIAVVYLLLSAKNIHDLVLLFFQLEISYCYVVLIVAAAFLPCTFLRSPEDFWGAVVVGMFTSVASALLIVAGGALDMPVCAPHRRLPAAQPANYFLALGTYLFSYCGHAAFPTIQHDMRRPADFTKSVVAAFALTTGMYVPVATVGYFAYGDSMRHSVINSLQVTGVQPAVNVLITIHCVLTLTIVLNPLNQEVEDLFGVPHRFGVKRIASRTLTMLAVVFAAESVPNFGPLLDLVGGSTMTLTGLIFPCLFYLRLKAAEPDRDSRAEPPTDAAQLRFGEVLSRNRTLTTLACLGVMGLGAALGAASTASAVRALSATQFVLPCYLQPLLGPPSAEAPSTAPGAVACCGAYRNVSRSAHVRCAAFADAHA